MSYEIGNEDASNIVMSNLKFKHNKSGFTVSPPNFGTSQEAEARKLLLIKRFEWMWKRKSYDFLCFVHARFAALSSRFQFYYQEALVNTKKLNSLAFFFSPPSF